MSLVKGYNKKQVENHAGRSPLEGSQDKHGVHTAGTGHADNLYIHRVSKSAASRQVCACVGAPVAAERYNLRSKFCIFYLHIASTSARICLFEKPCRSIAPDGQATVHAPQP